jgi:glycerol-1-phosphatase
VSPAAGPVPLGPVDGVVCDLDGVVYRGRSTVPHAVQALRRMPVPIVYVTNNASIPAEIIADRLRGLGIDVADTDVVTSAQAGAAVIARTIPGAVVLAVGGPGVAGALEHSGLVATTSAEGAEAVLQGYGPDVRARDLAEAAYAVADGAWWVATNTDATIPTDRGVAPGNGSLVGVVSAAVGRGPDAVVGKPRPDLYRLAAERLGVEPGRTLAVGDRLDTDIEGATAAGLPSALVLTGIDSRESAKAAPPHRRPTRILEDLRGLSGLVRPSSGTSLG